MRDRLIDLLTNDLHRADNPLQFVSDEIVERLADMLLENGVIAPPCKVGDKVYFLEDWGYKKELRIKEIGTIAIKGVSDYSKALWEDSYGGYLCSFADFGKTAFLTKEEAEQALKGGAE